jgi:N-acetylglucosaminyl-diphospho-decaprenol L-rhamnosyltransferase
MLDLGIVIVNWNTRDLLRECLRSAYASRGDFTFQVCVVDNASADDSAAMVRAEFPQAQVIESQTNVGYPAANNLGLRAFGFGPHPLPPSPPPSPEQSSGEGGGVARSVREGGEVPRYALLLNPDTVLPGTALADMLAYIEAHPCCGAAGPKLVLPNGDLDLACRRSLEFDAFVYRMLGLSRLFPRSRRFGRYNLTYLSPDAETEVGSVVGAFMLVRREAIAQAGLMDEAFFMYGEDLDWAFAIKQAGWEVRYNPAVAVQHVKRAASRMSRRAQIAFEESMLIFYYKHYAAVTPPVLGALVVLGIRLRLAWTLLRERLARPGGRPAPAKA